MPLWAGVDGCRDGWVLAVMDPTRSILDLALLRTFGEVVIHARGADLILVDIPMGLPSADCPVLRRCDTMARELLGTRASTVFPVPAREAVWAESYPEACRLNRRILGRDLSRQSWGICPKIREVDAVLRLAPRLQDSIRETHPELCFRLLNRGRPLANPKKGQAGQRVRRELLRGFAVNLDAATRQARRLYRSASLSPDDLLDAVAAAVVARLAAEGKAASVPLAPERDACGLAMEVVGV